MQNVLDTLSDKLISKYQQDNEAIEQKLLQQQHLVDSLQEHIKTLERKSIGQHSWLVQTEASLVVINQANSSF